jgi:hypothetical protein
VFLLKRKGNAYVIFRNGYEEIDGVVVRGTPLGDAQLQPYVKEPQEKNNTLSVAQVTRETGSISLLLT